MNDFDPAKLEQWATGFLERLSQETGRGVLMGGSIARGQQWAHSDLESALLLDAADSSRPYFNVDSGHGVEIIQLIAPTLSKQIDDVERGDLSAVSTWPIQMYQARVICDPTGLLKKFVKNFDRHLFSPEVVGMKLTHHVTKAKSTLTAARAMLTSGRPHAALCEVRSAMNETVLSLYWSRGELPRSHNRVESRLRDLTTRHNLPDFCALYRDVYDMDSVEEVIKVDWPVVKESVFRITALWRARSFFEIAIDSSFSWGENGGIMSVHRLFIPIIGRPEGGIFNSLDDSIWAKDNPHMLRFLGLVSAGSTTISQFADRIEHQLAVIKPM